MEFRAASRLVISYEEVLVKGRQQVSIQGSSRFEIPFKGLGSGLGVCQGFCADDR